MIIWYGLSSALLGVILFFPTRKIILGLSVNRHRHKVQREITEEEFAALKKKVTMAAVVICMTFAFLYNKMIMLKFFGGPR